MDVEVKSVALGKRAHSEAGKSNSSAKKSKSSGIASFPPVVQSALYAAERLMCHPCISHTIDIILVGMCLGRTFVRFSHVVFHEPLFSPDDVLHLWWYDKQNAIQSYGIRITEHLPYLVAMIMIFQRFNPRTWGASEIDLSNLSITGNEPEAHGDALYEIDEETRKGQFQLIGRCTFTADVLLKNLKHNQGRTRGMTNQNSTQAKEENRRFLKISWPEANRDPEWRVIETARTRIQEIPDVTIQSSVRNHIPIVWHHHDIENAATDTIRHLLELPVRGTRILRMIVFEKLRPIITLEPDDLWVAFWQIVQCEWP